MALPKQIQQREYTKFIEDRTGKVAVRTYDQALIELNANYTQLIEYDGQGNAVYIGLAEPGTAQGDAFWQIKHLTYDSGNNVTSLMWADGNDDFDNSWDDRASLSYS
jgi:hypothetical protein